MIGDVLISAGKRFSRNQKGIWNDPNIHDRVMPEAVVVEKIPFLKVGGFRNHKILFNIAHFRQPTSLLKSGYGVNRRDEETFIYTISAVCVVLQSRSRNPLCNH